MLRIDVISAVPQLLQSPLDYSIVGRARSDKKVTVEVHDLRDYSKDKHRKVDDYPYGGGAGMVLTPQPIVDCIEHLQEQRSYDQILFTAPDGEMFTQKAANELSLKQNLIILCGHYKGIDERVRELLIDKTYSIGDFVLSGGELPALVIIDALVRLLPGVLGDAESALEDSFQNGLLGPPQYTRPANFRGKKVPNVLTSGNHKKIDEWRHEQSLERTKKLRPDMLSG